MTKTIDKAAVVAVAVAEIIETYTKSIQHLTDAVAAERNTGRFVFCWPKYWLGVLVDPDGRTHAVSIDRATVTDRFDNRSFLNGSNERAVLLPRRQALQRALEFTKKSFADIQAHINA